MILFYTFIVILFGFITQPFPLTVILAFVAFILWSHGFLETFKSWIKLLLSFAPFYLIGLYIKYVVAPIVSATV